MQTNKLTFFLSIITILLFIMMLYAGNLFFTNFNNAQNSRKIVDNAIFHHDEVVKNYINLKEELDNENE